MLEKQKEADLVKMTKQDMVELKGKKKAGLMDKNLEKTTEEMKEGHSE